jgi:hypothetical protein
MSRVRMPPIAASSIITRPVTVVSSTGKEKSQHQYKQDVAHDRIRSKLFCRSIWSSVAYTVTDARLHRIGARSISKC